MLGRGTGRGAAARRRNVPPHPTPRRLLQGAYTPQAIRAYLPRLQAAAEAAVREWVAAGEIK